MEVVSFRYGTEVRGGGIYMNRGRVGEERGGKETDRCPLTRPGNLNDEDKDKYLLPIKIDAGRTHDPLSDLMPDCLHHLPSFNSSQCW
jgi:hypothetical protein